MKTLYYRIADDDGDPEFDEYFPLLNSYYNPQTDPRWAVEEAAVDFYEYHDGGECDWPLAFALHDSEGGKEICRYEVHLSNDPVFKAADKPIKERKK